MSQTDPTPPLTVAVWQCVSQPLDVPGNLRRLEDASRRAAAAGADVLVAPEMFTTGYDIPLEDTRRLAEPTDGPTARRVAQISAAAGLAIVYGYPELGPDGEIYNAVQLVDGDRVVARHRKLQLFGDLDRERFAPGAALAPVAELRGHPVGLLICYDVEFPETVRGLALAGARTVLVPTANMAEFDLVPTVLVRARAYENGVGLAYANFCGTEGTLQYGGLSTVCAGDGTVVALAGRDEDLLVARLVPVTDSAFLTDRRADLS